MGEETFKADHLILLLPDSSLCLGVISSSASNPTTGSGVTKRQETMG